MVLAVGVECLDDPVVRELKESLVNVAAACEKKKFSQYSARNNECSRDAR